MAELSPKTREAIRKQWSKLHRSREKEFVHVLAAARASIPAESQTSLFPYIIRELWEQERLTEHVGDLQEIADLPVKIEKWWERHEWMKNVEVRWRATTPDLEPLARMLLSVRRTQRMVEEVG